MPDPDPNPNPPPVQDDPPTIAAIANRVTEEGVPVDVTITITDETPATVTLSATSSNATLVPASGLGFSGADATRTLSVSPSTDENGSTTITVIATDAASQTGSASFQLLVNAPPPPPPPAADFSWSEFLLASDGHDSNQFGSAVAVSGDLMAVGTRDAFGPGTAYVFRNDQGVWTEVWKESRFGTFFGLAIALEGDYLVASRYEESFIYRRGSVAADDWIVEDSVEMGVALALSDGRLLATDGYSEARVLTRTGGSWPVTSTIIPVGVHPTDDWGVAADLDGTVAVIGAPADDDAGTDAGAAYVYRLQGGTWTLEQKLVATDTESGDAFGRSVAVDGGRIVVGAPYEDEAIANGGAAYIFELHGGQWTEVAKLIEHGGGMGWSVAIRGNEVIVGAPSFNRIGQAFHYRGSGSSWVSAPLSMPTQNHGRDMGRSVAFDGNTAVLGAPGQDYQAFNAGAVHIFVR